MIRSSRPLALAIAAALLAIHGAAHAEDGIERAAIQGTPFVASGLEIEAGHARERLDKSYYAEWQNTYITAEKRSAGGHLVYGTLRQTERFQLTDQELLLGAYLPVMPATLLLLEGTGSGSHKVLPQWSALIEIDRFLGDGWGAGLGLRKTEYAPSAAPAGRLLMGIIRIERYIGDLYASYTLRPVTLEGGGSTNSHSLKLNWYYGDRNFAGANYSAGQEIDYTGTAAQPYLTSDTLEYMFTGRHWLTGQWGISWEAGSHKHGTFYTRNWVSAGIRYAF